MLKSETLSALASILGAPKVVYGLVATDNPVDEVLCERLTIQRGARFCFCCAIEECFLVESPLCSVEVEGFAHRCPLVNLVHPTCRIVDREGESCNGMVSVYDQHTRRHYDDCKTKELVHHLLPLHHHLKGQDRNLL